ncbi:hypothetical protein AA103587_1012 [Gluconobacter kanchanaburiensis NBRC 103587]|nr:hypothetical protein AA103587_1012 [Gluconobacter kanchanaburiensis NBRC 103587]
MGFRNGEGRVNRGQAIQPPDAEIPGGMGLKGPGLQKTERRDQNFACRRD